MKRAILYIFFCFSTFSVFCQKDIDSTSTKDLSALYPDTVKYYLSHFALIGKNEISDETLIRYFNDWIDWSSVPDPVVDEILEHLYKNLDTLNKLYPLNYSILSSKMYFSTLVKNKRYAAYADNIIELVHSYYDAEENYYWSAKSKENKVSKSDIFQKIKSYGMILNLKSGNIEYKRINDLIYQYDPHNYVNLIFRANYFRNTLQFDEAINVLNNEIAGFDFDEEGNIINDYNPNSVNYFLALTYFDMGNMVMALETINYINMEEVNGYYWDIDKLRKKILDHK